MEENNRQIDDIDELLVEFAKPNPKTTNSQNEVNAGHKRLHS